MIQRRYRDENEPDRFANTRNVLNLIFMIGSIIGILLYYTSNHETGTYVIIAAIIFKAIECVLRFVK